MNLTTVLYGVEGGVATLTLDRPEARNALNRAMCDDIVAATAAARDDAEVRLVLIRGSGPVFCAGADLKERKGMAPDEVRARRLAAYAAYGAIESLPMPAIAIVHGAAVGSGCDIAAACDFVIATHRSRWGMPEINWGITPGWGGTGRLSKFAGRRKTKEWNLLGYLFNAATAERYDLVNRLCEPESLDAEITALTEVLLSKDRHATTVTKYFVDKGADLDMWSSMFFEGNPARFGPGENAMAGIQDFTEKSTRDERRKLIMNFWQD